MHVISEARTTLTEQDLYELPVHGPNGRIAAVRRELRLKQHEFAAAIGVSREAISHWENVDDDGEPRHRTSRQSAEAIAQLVRERLGFHVSSDVFYGSGERAWEALRHDQQQIRGEVGELAAQVEHALELLREIRAHLARQPAR